jgi:hypothetical protein
MNVFLVVLLIALAPVPVPVNTEMFLTPYADEAACRAAGAKVLAERGAGGKEHRYVYACISI